MKDKNKKDKLKDDVIDLGPMLRSLSDSVPPKPKQIIDLGPYLERYKKQEKALLSDNSRQEQIPPPVAVREPIDETPPAVGSKSVISNQEQPPHTDEIQPNAEIEEPKETVVFDNGREVEEPEIPTVEIPEENVLPPESAGDTAVGDPDNQNLAQLTDDHERLRVASNQAPAETGTETDLQATPQSAVGQPELPEQSELFEQPETPVTGVDKKAAQADVAKELSAAQEAVISAAETPEVPKAVAKADEEIVRAVEAQVPEAAIADSAERSRERGEILAVLESGNSEQLPQIPEISGHTESYQPFVKEGNPDQVNAVEAAKLEDRRVGSNNK